MCACDKPGSKIKKKGALWSIIRIAEEQKEITSNNSKR